MTNDKSNLYAQIMTGLLLLNNLPLPIQAQFGTKQRQPVTLEAASSNGCETKHDRFNRKTTSSSAPRVIYRSSNPREELTVSARVIKDDERENSRAKEVELIFLSVAEHWRYHELAEINFLLDGKKVTAGTAYAMGGVPVMSQIQEKMQLTLATEKFLQIINGREVEMKMGPTEIVLKSADLEALRSFAKCAGLQTQ